MKVQCSLYPCAEVSPMYDHRLEETEDGEVSRRWIDFGSHYCYLVKEKTEMQHAMLMVIRTCIIVVMWCNKIVLGDRAQYEWLLVLLGWEIIEQNIEIDEREKEVWLQNTTNRL